MRNSIMHALANVQLPDHMRKGALDSVLLEGEQVLEHFIREAQEKGDGINVEALREAIMKVIRTTLTPYVSHGIRSTGDAIPTWVVGMTVEVFASLVTGIIVSKLSHVILKLHDVDPHVLASSIFGLDPETVLEPDHRGNGKSGRKAGKPTTAKEAGPTDGEVPAPEAPAKNKTRE